MISFMDEVIKTNNSNNRSIAGSLWVETPPEMWSNEEKDIYDMMIELETKIKTSIIEIINPLNNSLLWIVR